MHCGSIIVSPGKCDRKDLDMHSIPVRHLFISPGHNYFGHHDLPAGTNPIIEKADVECVAGKGIRGDRFFEYQKDYKGQITFFSIEVLRAVCDALSIPPVSPGVVRRNVIVDGVDLNHLIGETFELQGVLFEGVCECKPCYWMDQAIAPGAEISLRGRGGLRARILTDGWLRADPR
jgi:hypothetical protein